MCTQKSWKLSLAFSTASLGGLTVTFVAVINADLLYANDELAIAIWLNFCLKSNGLLHTSVPVVHELLLLHA